MSDDKTKAEELLQEAKGKSRHETEPTREDDSTPPLEDAVADAYRKIEDGDMPTNLTLRDENLAALFGGLEESEQLTSLGEAAADELSRDAEIDTRADVLRMLLRYAITEIDEDTLESAKAGRRQFIAEQADDF